MHKELFGALLALYNHMIEISVTHYLQGHTNLTLYTHVSDQVFRDTIKICTIIGSYAYLFFTDHTLTKEERLSIICSIAGVGCATYFTVQKFISLGKKS